MFVTKSNEKIKKPKSVVVWDVDWFHGHFFSDHEAGSPPAGNIECHLCPNLFNKAESYRIRISAVKVLCKCVQHFHAILGILCPIYMQQLETFIFPIWSLQVIITANDAAALWHAANTVLQILRLFSGRGVPPVQVCATSLYCPFTLYSLCILSLVPNNQKIQFVNNKK